jgi:hypothetical protein
MYAAIIRLSRMNTPPTCPMSPIPLGISRVSTCTPACATAINSYIGLQLILVTSYCWESCYMPPAIVCAGHSNLRVQAVSTLPLSLDVFFAHTCILTSRHGKLGVYCFLAYRILPILLNVPRDCKYTLALAT